MNESFIFSETIGLTEGAGADSADRKTPVSAVPVFRPDFAGDGVEGSVTAEQRMTGIRRYSEGVDRNLSILLQKCSSVDLYIRNSLGTPSIQTTIKGFIDNEGSIWCQDGRFGVNQRPCFFPSLPLRPAIPHGLSWQPECDPMFLESLPGFGMVVHNGDNELQAKFPMIRAYCCSIGTIGTPDGPLTQAEKNAGLFLFQRLNLDLHVPANPSGGWRRAYIDLTAEVDSNARRLPFADAEGTLQYVSELIWLNGRPVLLPLAFFQHPDYHHPLRLYLQPEEPQLWGVDNLRRFPEAIVILTDDAGTALANPLSETRIFLGAFDELGEIPQKMLIPLCGRECFWLLVDGQAEDDARENFRRALRMKQKCAEVGVHLKVLCFCPDSENKDEWGLLLDRERPCPRFTDALGGSAVLLDDRDFLRQAQAHRLPIPEILNPDRLGKIDLSAGWIPAAPLLAPVVDAGGNVVIYERSGVPPFILCGPLGVTASTGKSEIPEYLTVDRPLRTLMLADPGQGRRILQKHSLNAIVPADLMLYETVFMQSDDALPRLQEIIHSASFELALVASPGLIANSPVAQALLRECRCAGIGVVVVHSEDLSGPPPKWLGAVADVGWELWKLPGEAAGFVFKRPGDFDATTLRRTDPGWVASSSTAREKDMAGIPPVQITPGVISS